MKSRVSLYEELVFAIMIALPGFVIGKEEGHGITKEGGKGFVVKTYWPFEVSKLLLNKLDSFVACKGFGGLEDIVIE